MPERVFKDAPIKIKYYLITLIIIASTLYIDKITGPPYTNVIVFFVVSTIFPIFMAAYASGVAGERLDEMLSFRGDILYIISMLLITAGIIGLMFFFVIRPLSMMYIGTDMYKIITVLHMPLSSEAFFFATTTPLYSFIFYASISVGEECLKIWGWKSTTNWLYDKFGVGKNVIIIIGLLFSFLGWLSLHFILGWAGIPPLPAIGMGIVLSVLFMLPYYFGENIISPEKGIQLNRFSIWAPISGHLTYDFLLSMQLDGFLEGITLTSGQIISGIFLLVGIGFLIVKYYQIGFFSRTFSFREILR